MKKPNDKTGHSAIAITATIPEHCLLQSLVEKLAYRHIDIGYSRESVPVGSQAIETSSLEAHVSGEIILSDENDLINMPFVSCFLFTCTKSKRGDYKLSWSNSLS